MIKKHNTYGVQVSEDGKIYWLDGTEIRLGNDRYKRIRVARLDNYKIYSESVHRLVVQTFIGEIPKGMVVNHKDGNKHNNNLSNLEIVTPSQNTKHALENKLFKAACGVKTGKAKLKEEDVLQIYKYLKSGISNKELAKKFNVNFRTISQIKTGFRWNHLHRVYFN